MDKRIYIIGVLAVLAAILTVVKERHGNAAETLMGMPSSGKMELSGERLYGMADTTLRMLGVKKENIRPLKNRNDVRVLYPQGFDVLNFIGVMKDSLEGYNAKIFSVDNAKERAAIVQFKKDDTIVRSFLFSKEPGTVSKKGTSPSQRKK